MALLHSLAELLSNPLIITLLALHMIKALLK